MRTRIVTGALAALALGGCSGADGSDSAPVVAGTAWEPLIATDWTLDPGTERYLCVRRTLENDIDLRAFQAEAPSGTHHTVLTVGAPTGPDGVVECDSFENHSVLVYGSGLGAEPFELPDGVAVRLEAGQQLLLNLHLFNIGNGPLASRSEIRARSAAPEDVKALAEGLLVGPVDLTLPPGKATTVNGGCTLQDDAYVFGVAPHMHQLGTHMKVVADSTDDGTVTLHDASYAFEDQQPHRVDPVVHVSPGDRIDVECQYQNTTGTTVEWGESTKSEMCFAGIYRYPKRETGFFVCSK